MFPLVDRESPSQIHFRKRARREREQRGWSQADVAKKLTAKGIDKIHPTTVAKIESGDREVKLDEATAIADLFDMSLDVLVARHSTERREDELTYYLRQLRDNARRHASQVGGLAWAVSGDVTDVSLDGVPDDIADTWAEIEERSNSVVHHLETAADDLKEIADHAAEIVARRQGKGNRQ